MNEQSPSDLLAQKFQYFFATLLTVCAFTFLVWASFIHDYAANPESKDIINTVIGFLLATALSSVVQYFFSSTAGSKRKDDRVNELIQEIKK